MSSHELDIIRLIGNNMENMLEYEYLFTALI